MPAEERLRRDHERRPTVSAERAARRGEEGPILVAKFRSPDRASEHLHLVAEDGVLELELRHAPTCGEHPDETDQHEVDERSQGVRDATCQRQSQGTEFWSSTPFGP